MFPNFKSKSRFILWNGFAVCVRKLIFARSYVGALFAYICTAAKSSQNTDINFSCPWKCVLLEKEQLSTPLTDFDPEAISVLINFHKMCSSRSQCVVRRWFEMRWKVQTLAQSAMVQLSKSDHLGLISSRLQFWTKPNKSRIFKSKLLKHIFCRNKLFSPTNLVTPV